MAWAWGLPASTGLGSCSGMPAICLIDITTLGTGSMRGDLLGAGEISGWR